MDKKYIEDFFGKTVKVVLKDRFTYTGKIVFLDEHVLKIDDRFKGIVLIDLFAIDVVVKANEVQQ